MTSPLRVGVIGLGDFGEQHVDAYSRQTNVTIVGVADINPERARAVASRWGVEHYFASAAQLIAACRPDGVSIVSPGTHHVEQTLLALAENCSVLLEKPIAMSSSEVDAIEEAAGAASAFVQPAHILRFTAPYVALRSRVQSGAIGMVLGISALRDRDRDHERLYGDVHPALMTMIHDIDLALWISGSEAVTVSAHERGGEIDGPPLLLRAQIEAADGSLWTLGASWLLPVSASLSDRLEVYGTTGVATLDLRPTVNLFGATLESIDHEVTREIRGGALERQIDYFCTCLRTETPPSVVTLKEAAHGVRIAEAIIRSASRGGQQVNVTT